MKALVSVLLVLLANLSFAQKGSANSMDIDWRVQFIEATSLDTLTQQLTAPYTTDYEKVRSIFRWITDHISYKVISYPALRHTISSTNYLEDTATELKTLDERVAQSVLRKREAVCDGYARLFKTLCDYAGIKAEVITGYARTNLSGRARFRSNHTWNAVLIDSSWHLLDATWASGYVSFNGNDFIKAYDDFYFLTPPQDFIRDHYPEDLQWTLLAHPPTLQEFQNAPFTSKAFVTSRILSYKPAKGVIEASVGDSIRVELETDDPIKTEPLSDSLLTNTTALSGTLAFLKPAATARGKKINYTYTVASSAVEWLNIVYDDEVIMRYKLNIKKDKQEEIQSQ